MNYEEFVKKFASLGTATNTKYDKQFDVPSGYTHYLDKAGIPYKETTTVEKDSNGFIVRETIIKEYKSPTH